MKRRLSRRLASAYIASGNFEMALLGIIFDLDGTLIDSRGDIAAACRAMLYELGRPLLSEEIIASFVGDGARALVERALPEVREEGEIERAVDRFLTHYESFPIAKTKILPGVLGALDALVDRRLAVCTNKPRRTTEPVLAGLDLARHFGAVVAGGDTKEKKPHPEPVMRACELLGVHASEALMIGDGPQDILAARAAGVRSVGVKGGILELERLLEARPDHLLETMAELPGLIQSLR